MERYLKLQIVTSFFISLYRCLNKLARVTILLDEKHEWNSKVTVTIIRTTQQYSMVTLWKFIEMLLHEYHQADDITNPCSEGLRVRIVTTSTSSVHTMGAVRSD